MVEWQDIATAPKDACIDIWVACIEQGIAGGWRITGIILDDDPHRIMDDEGRTYFPHENGGYATHWMPLPSPPDASDA